MQRLSPRDVRPYGRLMRRLDRVAGELNPILIISMVGLMILIAVRVATMGLSNLPITRIDPSCMISPAPATSM